MVHGCVLAGRTAATGVRQIPGVVGIFVGSTGFARVEKPKLLIGGSDSVIKT
jgi:hypothetical protein